MSGLAMDAGSASRGTENGTFHYVAGMYTAVLLSIAGWWAFVVVVRETRRSRASNAAVDSHSTVS